MQVLSPGQCRQDVLFAYPFLVHASNGDLSGRARLACSPHVDLLGPLQLEGPANGQSLVIEGRDAKTLEDWLEATQVWR